jgi:L-cystine uptake protein TcyP (sodium:dicarboxylate symporter family)
MKFLSILNHPTVHLMIFATIFNTTIIACTILVLNCTLYYYATNLGLHGRRNILQICYPQKYRRFKRAFKLAFLLLFLTPNPKIFLKHTLFPSLSVILLHILTTFAGLSRFRKHFYRKKCQ